MKTKMVMLFTASVLAFSSCGDMSNNSNEDNSQYTDSSGMNADNSGNPDASTAPMRNVYDTDSMTSTSGPDNAAPKSSSQDSAVSTQPNR